MNVCVLCAVCIVKLGYTVCLQYKDWCYLMFESSPSQCFFLSTMWLYSLLGFRCKTVELLLLQIHWFHLTSLKISLGFWFTILWNNHGTNLSSSYLSFPTEEMKPAVFKIFLGEAFYPAVERWSLTETRQAMNSEGLIIHEVDSALFLSSPEAKALCWRSLCSWCQWWDCRRPVYNCRFDPLLMAV